ncbi:MAG: T9SS type A sorting domain-containing protein [Flavobacteriales bacterium]|nr:T9SS type A sorting domain-containing protein [Flavobacteriales bacterium]
MIKTLALVLSTITNLAVLGQAMFAGITQPEDNLRVIDTTILAPPQAGTNSLIIDANLDGTPDLLVSVLNADGGQWFHYYRTTIAPLSGCALLGSAIDTCFGNSEAVAWIFGRAAELVTGDPIPGLSQWSDTTLSLARSGWMSNYPDGFGLNCWTFSTLEQDTGYVAFRIIALSDTLLGWMRISNVTSAAITVHDLALRTISTDIVDLDPKGSSILFPNPTNGILHLNGSLRSAGHIRFEVFDASARRVMEFMNRVADPVLDMGGLPPGPYTLRCWTDEKASTYRFVVLK